MAFPGNTQSSLRAFCIIANAHSLNMCAQQHVGLDALILLLAYAISTNNNKEQITQTGNEKYMPPKDCTYAISSLKLPNAAITHVADACIICLSDSTGFIYLMP